MSGGFRCERMQGWLAAAVVTLVVTIVPATAEAKRNLYVGGNTSDNIAGFDLAADGAISPIAGSPFPSGPLMRGGLISPNGQLAYSANDGNIRGYTVDAATGALAQVAGSPFASGANLRSLAFRPDGAFVYFALRNTDQVQAFSVAADGTIAAVGAPAPAGDQPNNPVVTPDGQFLYQTNFISDDVTGYSIAADGTLTPLSGFPVAGINGAQGAQISPDGRFLFIGANNAGTIFSFGIGADGSLTPVAGSPFPTGDLPRSITLSPDGTRLYSANQGTDNVSAFTVTDGVLAPVAGSPFAAADGPTGAVVTPDGSRLYISNEFSNNINAYDIGADGGLSQVPGSPFAAGVTAPETAGLFITPNQPPVAGFTTSAGIAGAATTFNAGGTTDSDGTASRFDWDFGDGQSAQNAGPTPSHTYANPGTFAVSVTVTDNEGCSTTQVWTGQTPLCNGSSVARAQQQITVRDGTPPGLKLSGKKRQELDGSIEVKVKCTEACDAEGTGKLTVREPKGGRAAFAATKFKFKRKDIFVKAGAKKTLKLKLRKSKAKKAEKALDEAGKSTAKIKVVATDDAGNDAKATRKIKVKPEKG